MAVVDRASLEHVKDLLKQKEYDEALRECDKQLASDPGVYQLNVFAGKAAFELAQFDRVRPLPHGPSLPWSSP